MDEEVEGLDIVSGLGGVVVSGFGGLVVVVSVLDEESSDAGAVVVEAVAVVGLTVLSLVSVSEVAPVDDVV